MTKTAAQLTAEMNRIISTPKHLQEFEEQCYLRSLPRLIAQAQASERHAAEVAAKSQLSQAALDALLATADYAKEAPETRKSLLTAVSHLYLELSK